MRQKYKPISQVQHLRYIFYNIYTNYKELEQHEYDIVF